MVCANYLENGDTITILGPHCFPIQKYEEKQILDYSKSRKTQMKKDIKKQAGSKYFYYFYTFNLTKIK